MESNKQSFFVRYKDINFENFDSETLVQLIKRNVLTETRPKEDNIEDFDFIKNLTQKHSLRDSFVFQKEYEINPFFKREIFKDVQNEIENTITKKLNNFNSIRKNLESEPLLKDKILNLKEQYKFTLNQIEFKQLMDDYLFYKGTTKSKYYKDWNNFVINHINEETIILYLNGDKRYKSIDLINQHWEWFYQTKIVTEFCLNEIKRLESEIILAENINSKEDLDKRKIPLPQSIAMLKKIGFFDLELVKNLSKDSKFEIISIITGSQNIRSIKGNVNVLDADSIEDTMRYTSHLHLKKMADKLKSLK